MQPPQMLGYDRAITVFSPQGRLYQVEYAREAVKKGTVSLGIVYADGVLLAADKNITEDLMIARSVEKLYKIDEHIGCATSGLVADGRRLVDRARVIAQSHRLTYDESIGVDQMTREISDYQQLHTQIAGVRPFGTALLIAGVDEEPRLYETDPSGSFWEYKATAIGEDAEKVRDIFQKEYKEGISFDDAVNLALKALYKGTKERFTARSIEMVKITSDKKYHRLSQSIVEKHLNSVLDTLKKGGSGKKEGKK